MAVDKRLLALISYTILAFYANIFGQIHWDMAQARDIDNILSVKDQARVFNENLQFRLDSILPKIMRREGIDLWVVMNLEYNEDPVYMTLVSKPAFNARRLSILVFHDGPKGFKKYNVCWWGQWTCGPLYEDLFTDRTKGGNHQFTVLAEFIEKVNPKKIGINYADHWEYHDSFSHGFGISAHLKEKFERSLKQKHRKRITSAEYLCLGWLETRSPRELSLYHHLCGIGHDLIAEFFSNKVIVPDVTTTDDVKWWIRQRITDLGLRTWFHPTFYVIRSPKDSVLYGTEDTVIRRGDVLHCDVGLSYLGISSDMQHNAYVCRIGEKMPPKGLITLYNKGNRVQEIMLTEFQKGKKGNDILKSCLEKSKSEGINAKIYTHPVGFYGHGAGMTVGMWDKQDGVPGTGEHPLYPNTVYAIEFGVKASVPEWDNKEVYLGFEDQGVFTESGANFVDGYPRQFYLIK